MNGSSGTAVYHAIKIQLDRYGKNARLGQGIRNCDKKRNTRLAQEFEKHMPERSYALVDANGKIYKYCMMKHYEAKEKSKQTSLLGFRWTQCTPQNISEVKTK
jgi:hypothetical protein